MTNRNYNITWSVVNRSKNLAGFASWNAWAGRILQPFAWIIGLPGVTEPAVHPPGDRPAPPVEGRGRAEGPQPGDASRAGRGGGPGCGDAPMMWKERYTTVGGGLRWLGGRPVVPVLGVLLGCYLFDVAYPALAGMLQGAPMGPAGDQPRRAHATTALSALGLLTIAAASAVAITGEREQDTWTSLRHDPADARRGHPRQAVRRPLECPADRPGPADHLGRRRAPGAIHPSGVLLAAEVAAVVRLAVAASVGVFASATARNSTAPWSRRSPCCYSGMVTWSGCLAGRGTRPVPGGGSAVPDVGGAGVVPRRPGGQGAGLALCTRHAGHPGTVCPGGADAHPGGASGVRSARRPAPSGPGACLVVPCLEFEIQGVM